MKEDSENNTKQDEVVHIDFSKAKSLPITLAALAASMSAYNLGTIIGWASPVQPQLQQLNNSYVHVTDENSTWYIKLNNDEMSWVGSLINLGALFGALVAGSIMDKFGRKNTLIATSVPYAIGWLLIITAVDPSMLYIGRIVGGFAGGMSSVVSPSYVGEIATPSMRGALGFFFQLLLTMGILITSCFGLFLDWRWISVICIIDPFILLVAMIFVPETPYHLVKKGKLDDAAKALIWLRGPDYDIKPEMTLLETRIKAELAIKSKFSDLYSPWAIKQVLVGIGLMVFQQVSGINAALYNAVAIFEAAGSTLDNLVSAVLLNVDQLVVTLIALFLVERLGRRILFLISMSVMGVAMFALGAFFYIQKNDEESAKTLGWLPLTSLIIFIAAFGVGAGPLPWVVLGEVLPAKVKAPASSVATFTNWLLAFIVTKTFVDIQAGLGEAGSFWLFGVFCILGSLYSIFLLPETKGKTPEQIQAFFGIKNPADNDSNQQTSDHTNNA